MRSFIAIPLDPALKAPLSRFIRGAPRGEGVSWSRDHQLHITLKFLGDVPDQDIAAVCHAAREASSTVKPFDIHLGPLGCFPAPANPRVLWVGVDDPDQACRRWVQAIDPLLADFDIKPETRAYVPHVTLARSRSTAGAAILRRVLAAPPTLASPLMTVREVVVFESTLDPGGARHSVLATIPLDRPAA